MLLAGIRGNARTSQAMQELGMVPLAEKRKIHHAVMAHKLVNGKGPMELCNRFKGVKVHEQDQNKLANRLRSKTKMDIQPEQHKTARYERSTLFRTVRAWNRTDPNSRKTENTSTFKSTIQRDFTRAYWTQKF